MRQIQRQEDEEFVEDIQTHNSRAQLQKTSSIPLQLPKSISKKKTILLLAILFLFFNALIFIYLQATYENLIQTLDKLPDSTKKFILQKKIMEHQFIQAKKQIYSLQKKIQKITGELNKFSSYDKDKKEFLSFQNTKISQSQKNPELLKATVTSLPLVLPSMNKKHQKIEDVLYPSEQVRKGRINFKNERVKFINMFHNSNPNLHLAKHNLILNQREAQQAQSDFDNEWRRIQNKFQLSKITTQISMCILVSGYNTNVRFKIESNLNSIFTQNYTNYKAIIMDDGSTDGSYDIYQKYLEFYGIDPKHYVLIKNIKEGSTLQNVYIATVNHCSWNSIVIILDADDQFIGRNVLKTFNWGYTTKRSGALYSNYYSYQHSQLKRGSTTQYTQDEKLQNLYRHTPIKFGNLLSYRTELFLKIHVKDLKDQDGNFYSIGQYKAIYFPIMELSCGRVNKVDGQYHYIYNTGFNEFNNRDRQDKIDKRIRGMKQYECNQEFKNRMELIP